MKKLFSTILFASFTSILLIAQPCGTNGPSVCTPTGGPAGGGFDDPNSIPCVEMGVAYDYSIQFSMFSTFSFQGQHNVDSIEFVSLNNLPCGLCWAVNKVNKRYAANEDGCLRISGLSNDNAGQYQLALGFNAWIDGIATAIPVSAFLSNQAGIKLFLRVKTNGSSNCPNVDTSSSANNLTATVGCSVGINDLNAEVSSVKIAPNPMTSSAVLSFNADKSLTYTMKITDVTGKEIESRILKATQGINEFEIKRNGLPAGIYFLSLTDGKGIIAKRFSVSE